MDSGLTFCSSSAPFVGFSASDRESHTFLDTPACPRSPTVQSLSSLLCLRSASTKCPSWESLTCLAPLFLREVFPSHSLPQRLWLCLGALHANCCFLFPSSRGLFLLLFMLCYLGGLITGPMLAFWKFPRLISWLCPHRHCLPFPLSAEQGLP